MPRRSRLALIASMALIGQLVLTPTSPGRAAASGAARPFLAPTTSVDVAMAASVHYRQGLIARAAGHSGKALQEFQDAAQADPQWADPHFSLAWAELFHDPGESLPELLQGLHLVGGSFRHQHLWMFHLLLWVSLALMLALLGLSFSAIVIGLPALHHRLTEFFARYLDRNYASPLAVLASILPYCMGLGVILPTLFLLAVMQPSLSGLARRLWALLLVATLAFPWVVREADSLLLPRTSTSWVGTAVRAQRAGITPEWLSRLGRAEAEATGRYEIPFARGVMELRAHRLDEAVRDFARADSLSHGNARTLNNLAVAEWMRGRTVLAENHLVEAIKADDRLTSPHYNLAQVLSRKLDFDGANREMLRAGALDFDRLRRHFNAFGMGQALMMQEELSPDALWKLWREETNVRTDWMEPPVWLASAWESRPGLFSILALLVLAVGSLLARLGTRWLPTYQCANCGATLCRRCSGRRRSETFCQTCMGHMSVTSGGPFGKVLLERRRSKRIQEHGAVMLVLRIVCPPFGKALARRWTLAGAWWFALSFLFLAFVKGGFWIHPGPYYLAGIFSVPQALLAGLLAVAIWIPAVRQEWNVHRREQVMELEARPQVFDQAA